MGQQLPRSPHHKVLGDAICEYAQKETLPFKPNWYFTKAEIEEYSPSRKDGIEHEQESHLRQLYCTYLQKLGMELKVPQVTIATAMMLCHRFYMHQSHAKNYWQTVATASMFLACKTEDTPILLKDLISVAYKLMYNWDSFAPQKIRQKEVYDKQKQLILLGERLILVTIAFDLNIEHPYKPLVAALKKLEISQKEVVKVAWNFVNDWLRTTLCLQFKPHYIAAGSIFLAAKFQKIKLPSANGKVWWMQFDVSPKQLEEVIQHMLQLLGQSSKEALPVSREARTETKPVAGKRKSDSTEYRISSGKMAGQDSRNYSMEKVSLLSIPTAIQCNQKQRHSNISGTEQKTDISATEQKTKKCHIADSSGSANSVVEDGDGEQITEDSNQKSSCKIVSIKECCQKIDITGIRERLKRRKLDRGGGNNKSDYSLEDEINNEAWIQSELEKGIVLV